MTNLPASPLRALLFAALVLPALGMAGCDTQLDLNECSSAPSPPTDHDYLGLDAGTSVVDGPEDERLNPDGRLSLPAEVLFFSNGERQYIHLGASGNQLPWVEILSFDPDTLDVGDEFIVSVAYNVNGSGEGGSGRMRVTGVTPEAVAGTFAGCVRSENRALSIYGPYRTVRGGFNATRD